MWANTINASRTSGQPKVTILTIEQTKNSSRRVNFNRIPITLSLPDTQVGELSALAGHMLAASPEYQSFVRSLHSQLH